jgi:hypothetical protein
MKYIILILLLFVGKILYAQSYPPLVMASKVTITNISTFSDPYTVQGVVQDITGNFDATDIQAGDSLYLLDGNNLLIYSVVLINSASGNNFSIVINDINDTGNLPPTGEGSIQKTTTNYNFPIAVGGLSETLMSLIDNRFKQRIDSILTTLGGLGTLGVYANDANAAANGVDINAYYILGTNNTVGAKPGTLSRRMN